MSRDGIYMKTDVLDYYIDELTPEEFKIYFKIRSKADGLGNWITRATFDPISESYVTPLYKQMRGIFTDTQTKTAISTLIKRGILNVDFLKDGNETYVLHSLLDTSKTNKEIVLSRSEIDYYKIHGWWQQVQVKDGIFYVSNESVGTKVANLLQNEKMIGSAFKVKDIRSKEETYATDLLGAPLANEAIEHETPEIPKEVSYGITARLGQYSSQKNKEAFANEVLSKYPELATNDSFLNELTDKTTNEAYKVLEKWTKKSIEHKEVTHDEADKVPMDVEDYSFLLDFRREFSRVRFSKEKVNELNAKLDEILNKYGISDYRVEILGGNFDLSAKVYVKQ